MAGQGGSVAAVASVLFVTRRFPPSVGGMQTLAADVWEALSADPGARLVAHGGELAGLPAFVVRAVWRTVREARRGTVDVVLAGDAAMFLALAPLARVLGVPVATMAMGKDVVWGDRWYRALLRRALRRAWLVVAISAETAGAVAALGVPDARLRVLRLGVRTPAAEPSREDARRELRRRLGLEPGTVVLATLGRLVRRKGVGWFVGQVLDGLPTDWVYVVAGDGEDRPAVAAARQAGGHPERVRLLGAVDDETRELVLRGCDAFVQPNVPVPGDLEGFGLVAVEAAMRGTLVVAADLEGLRDAVLPGSTGELVAPGDPAAWRHALVELLADAEREERAARYARACRELYGRDRMGQDLRALLEAGPGSGETGEP